MKKLHPRVLIMVIGLCFTGAAANPSRKSDIFLRAEDQWNEHPVANCSATYKDASQRARMDVRFCSFRVLIQSHTKNEQNRKHLDLSNHLISKMTLCAPAHWCTVEILNLSNNGILSISWALPTLPASQLKLQTSSIGNGLPFLIKVLNLQRNELRAPPRGLWRLKSLQSLDLSFNRISQLRPSDFHNCLRLENINLKSNKIFKIHPEAFKDLKNLQVVDLSNNALTTMLPLLTIALEFPHLEVDLAGNQWQCGDGTVDFQNFIPESWQHSWNEICNKSTGNKGAYLETPQIRTSRETHLPPSPWNPVESLIPSEAARPQEGTRVLVPTPRKEAVAGSALGKIQAQQPPGVRTPRDGEADSRKEDDPPDPALAICLSVLITFVVAFCLGAFARPYIDRLRQQRCLNKSPASENVFSNEGFSDDIVAARGVRPQQSDPHQASHHPHRNENQSPAMASPCRTPGKESGRQQSPAKLDSTGVRSREDDTLPNGWTPHSTLQRYGSADNHEPIASAQDHIYDNATLDYDTVAQEHSPRSGSITSTGQTVSGSTRSGWNESDLSHTREFAASLPRIHRSTHGTGESQETGCPERSPLETMGSQMESCKEMQVRNCVSVLGTHQPRPQEVSTDDSAIYSEVTYDGTRQVDPLALLPWWDPSATRAPEKPVEKECPLDPHYDDMETNYESDSEEGSLFTLSSEGSTDSARVTEEQAPGRGNGGASQSLPAGNSGEHKDSVTSVGSLEDSFPFQRTLEEYNTHEEASGNPFLPGADSGLYETRLESAANTSGPEDSLTWSRSLDQTRRPSCHETPGTFIRDYDVAPQSQEVDWHCSPRHLQFFNVDIPPPSPPYSTSDA